MEWGGNEGKGVALRPMTIPYSLLLDFTISIFLRIGCPEKDAHTAALALLSADLRGIDSHGVARLIGYVRRCQSPVDMRPLLDLLFSALNLSKIEFD